jgi:hypothetical protein
MVKRQNGSKDPDIISSEKALRRAARRALQIGLETGTPVTGELKFDEFRGLQHASDAASFVTTVRDRPGNSIKMFATEIRYKARIRIRICSRNNIV